MIIPITCVFGLKVVDCGTKKAETILIISAFD